MNMTDKRGPTATWLLLLAICTCFSWCSSARAESTPEKLVVAVDWKRFEGLVTEDEHYRRAKQILLNSARYNFAWAVGAAERIERDWRKLTGRQAHDVVRPGCEAAYALAVVLKTGIFDETALGVSHSEALERNVRLIKAVAAAHDGVGWKYPWQSAFWAAHSCSAGWLLWEDLDPPTRALVASIVQLEANRFIVPDYKVPYWNGKGGDTKAEENAWNSTILQLGCAMMPGHGNVPRWKEAGSRLMVSAYAQKRDVQSDAVIDGRAVKDWIEGYNAREDGAVVNHGFIHPDYMTAISLSLRAFPIMSLARQPVPEAADFRAPSVYEAFVTRRWPSPPFEAPGGTIYIPGSAEIYWPQGTDWFVGNVVSYYRMDVYAHLLGWDRELPRRAEHWMRLREEEMLRRESLRGDGSHYAPGQFAGYPGREQIFALRMADVFLLQWLRAHDALGPKGNWLAEP